LSNADLFIISESTDDRDDFDFKILELSLLDSDPFTINEDGNDGGRIVTLLICFIFSCFDEEELSSFILSHLILLCFFSMSEFSISEIS